MIAQAFTDINTALQQRAKQQRDRMIRKRKRDKAKRKEHLRLVPPSNK